MAAFIAKQLVGKKLDAVKGAVGGGDDKKDEEDTKKDEEAEEALAEQRREEEEKRRERHRQMEEERETVRQGIRDKYGIKKKETFGGMEDPARSGQIGRKRKTPEELAAEARGESIEGGENEGGAGFNLGGLTSKITDGPGQLVTQAQDKCSLM